MSCLLSISLAFPLGSPYLARRNFCDGQDASQPILYHEYHEAACPAKRRLNKTGDCPVNWEQPRCHTFCQTMTRFVYGLEQPFANSYCTGGQGGISCTISSTTNTAYSLGSTINFSGRLLDGFNAGISGTYTATSGRANARAFSIRLENNECGYFTFVPIVREVCGTMTFTGVTRSPDGLLNLCDSNKTESFTNACGRVLRPDPADPKAIDGTTLFVRTDCVTRVPLKDGQSDIYNQPGIALPRDI